MSFQYGLGDKPIRVERGIGYIPVQGLKGKYEVVVKPDGSAVEFLKDNASADGPDELFKKLLRAWFTGNQQSIDGQGWIFNIKRSDLEKLN
jgi:hypothetical protein